VYTRRNAPPDAALLAASLLTPCHQTGGTFHTLLSRAISSKMDFDQLHPDSAIGLERTIMSQNIMRDDFKDTSDVRDGENADAEVGTGAAAAAPTWQKTKGSGAAGAHLGYETAAGGHEMKKRQGLGKGAKQIDPNAVAVLDAHGRLPNGLTAFRKNGYNTGVKGVKADYEEAVQITKHNRIVGEIQKRVLVDRLTTGVTMQGPSISLSAGGGTLEQGERNAVDGRAAAAGSAAIETLFSRDNRSASAGAGGGGGGSGGDGGGGGDGDGDDEFDDLDSDADDDAFLLKYRQLRLQQMKQAAALPTFGRVTHCTPNEFVDAVDTADKRVFVVVHLYEERHILSRRMNDVLDKLAPQKPHVRFLRVDNSKCPTPVHDDALPAFLCYKGGELLKSVVAAYKEIGNTFSASEVDWLLDQQLDVTGVGAQ